LRLAKQSEFNHYL